MKQRLSTDDIEALVNLTRGECRELAEMIRDQLRGHGIDWDIPVLLGDPGVLHEGTRRQQAKSDLAYWRRERDRLREQVGEAVIDGRIV